jgi:hypothetical protein
MAWTTREKFILAELDRPRAELRRRGWSLNECVRCTLTRVISPACPRAGGAGLR